MPTTPISALPSISLVRDPLQISFQDAGNLASENEDFTELEVQVEIEDTYGSNEWRRVGEMLNPYGANDISGALIHRALMGALSPLPPDLSTSTAQEINGLIKKYRLRARDVIGGEPAGTFNNSDPAHAWLAGRSYLDFDTDILIGKAYHFLSTKPLARRYHQDEKIILYLLPLVSGTATLRAIIHFTDGTTQSDTAKTFGSVSPYRPKYLNYTLPTVSKVIDYIEFDITGLSGTAEKLTYKLISSPGPYFRQLVYLNSLGGYDSIPLIGKTEETHTDSGEIFDGILFPPLDAQVGNLQSINQRSVEGFTLRTGWISFQERQALKDLTLRNEAYLVEGTKLNKLLITNAAYQLRKDGEFLYSLEFQARYAYENVAYSRA
jgi:hypothetical protein